MKLYLIPIKVRDVRTYITIFSVLVSLVVMSACKKPGVFEPVEQPEIFPKGIINGNKVSKEIGRSGGELTSDDGLFKVSIPAGALPIAATVSIEAISNTNPGGIGSAYRVSPSTLSLSAAVKVEYKIQDLELDDSMSELLTVASQETSGVWRTGNSLVIDKSAHTIGISSLTFGDFSAMNCMELVSEKETLAINQQARIKVVSYIKMQGEDAFSAPISQNKLIYSAQRIPPAFRPNGSWMAQGRLHQ